MPHRPPRSPKNMAALTERYFEMPPFDQSGHFDLFPAFSQYPTDALLEDAAAAYAESANYDRFAHAAAAAAAATTSSYPSSMPQMTSLAPASNASAGSAIFSSPADYPLALAASYDGLKSEPGLATAIELPPSAKSWVSGASLPSAASSALGSPSSAVSQTLARSDPWSADVNGLGIAGIGRDGLVAAAGLGQDVALTAADDNKGPAGFVDPSLIHPLSNPMAHGPPLPQVPDMHDLHSPSMQAYYSSSPAPSGGSAGSLGTARPGSASHRNSISRSPYPNNRNAPHPYGPYATRGRRHSSSPGQTRPAAAAAAAVAGGRGSYDSPPSAHLESDDDSRARGQCPHPECGRVFRDLKAHLLTHQNERPEKCPIPSCEFFRRGFARKYDKNRHVLTHYRGTMVCGFCPGPGTSGEKSFNRADVFKRHLTHVHNVEQTPPNGRRRSTADGTADAAGSGVAPTGYGADATGKCSTCSGTFSNPQDFYEHLDECVLRVVQQGDPSESINERHMASMDKDVAVARTLRGHALSVDGATSPSLPGAGTIPERDETAQQNGDDRDMAATAAGDMAKGEQQQAEWTSGANANAPRSGQGMLRRTSHPQ
ncbi:MAG: hypothetical protein M1815_002014 [Lichina confinis]|nr:MAG: hypothetical protein M1815_002014 [Lichina confinis]